MGDILKQNKGILLLVLVVIIVFVWFGMGERQPQGTLLQTQGQAGASVAEQEILRLLLDMRSIRLDSSIFENPAFNTLRDFGREIVPEPVGRRNPFAPIEFQIIDGTETDEEEGEENNQ